MKKDAKGVSPVKLSRKMVERLRESLTMKDLVHICDTQGFRLVVGDEIPDPIRMLLCCPMCGARHIDEGEFATKVHHTHACQECGMVWRPAIEATVGVHFLPGFKN